MSVEMIGNKIRNKRKSLGITQKYLSAIANVGVRFISDLENGTETVELNKVIQVLDLIPTIIYEELTKEDVIKELDSWGVNDNRLLELILNDFKHIYKIALGVFDN